METELEVANQQILMLTEIVTLDPVEQASKLKEVEKLPLKAENLMRIKTLRSNLESIPPPSSRQSATLYSRFADSEFNNFSLSPEVLSEKLYDSVKMIRDLMTSNKKLKDTISEITSQKKQTELENVQLQNENQEMAEKIESLEKIVSKGRKSANKDHVNKNDKMKIKKFLQMENEQKTFDEMNKKQDWEWKTKKTVLRNHRRSQDDHKLTSIVINDRKIYKNSEVNNEKKTLRPLSRDLIMDSTKQEAIETLSKILMKGLPF